MSEQRRLAAILVADVAGFSRLVGADESGTLARLAALRRDIVDPSVARHAGRLFKATGDGFLVEFASAVQAVTCALEIQKASGPETLPLRIGIHVGDVVVQGDDLMGDGVNIAARIEGVAEPGGIAISRAVHEQVRDRIAVVFEDRGEIELKNIGRPVHIFAVGGERAPAAPALALPDRPSIAVLPFQNMSGDPEQEYFADGVVEDIITALSRFKSLFVIARNASFTYKGKAIDIRQVGRDLGVRYVLEGSIRKAGGRVRITGQLIEVATLAHIWADHVDGAMDDIFALQDQVTGSVVGALTPRLDLAEMERASRKPTENLNAYDWFLRGLAKAYVQGYNAWEEALRLFARAIELDPGYAPPYALSTRFYAVKKFTERHDDLAGDAREVRRLADRVSVVGKDDPLALCWAGHSLLVVCGDHDRSQVMLDQAMETNPNLAACWQTIGSLSMYQGRHQVAIGQLERALRFNPVGPDSFHIAQSMGAACFHLERYEDALHWANRARAHVPNSPIALQIAAGSLALGGNLEPARQLATHAMSLWPTMRVSGLGKLHPFRRQEDIDRWTSALRLMGIPE